MKILKNVYLVLALYFLLSFLDSSFDPAMTHKLLFWEANIWIYRLFRLTLAVYFMKAYFDKRNEDKIVEK